MRAGERKLIDRVCILEDALLELQTAISQLDCVHRYIFQRLETRLFMMYEFKCRDCGKIIVKDGSQLSEVEREYIKSVGCLLKKDLPVEGNRK